ncbi:YciI family protein [Isoptericola sp. NPDC057559]|uniref:YciI family protein n=1 Tax=Isoptericola sp. NPDC057559 TaxID=3346168 RepID=UPI0036D0AE8C
MTLYLLSVPHDSATEPTMTSMDPAELEVALAAVGALNADLEAAGALRFAGGLHPPSTATTIDGAVDTPTRTPGPFVEAAEYLGGLWVIEADDEDAALEWGTRAARALRGRIEVRAFQDVPEA